MRFDATNAAREITDSVLRSFRLPSRNGALQLGQEDEWKARVKALDEQMEKIVSRHFARFLYEEGKYQE